MPNWTFVRRPRVRGGFVFAACVLIALTLGPAVVSRFMSNVGLLELSRALVQYGAFGDAGQNDPNLATAERWLRSATDWDAGNRGAWRGLGFVLESQGRVAPAGNAWRAAGVTAQDFIAFGEQMRLAGRTDEALRWYQRAKTSEPDSARPWYYAGLAYESATRWDAARESFEQAIEQTLGIEDVLSSIYYRVGLIMHWHTQPVDLTAALEYYDAALASDRFVAKWERVDTHYNRGDVFRRRGRYAEAVNEFQWVLREEPDHYWAHIWLAHLAWQMDGDLDRAVRYLQQAIALKPDVKWAFRWLASIYQQAGRRDDAADMFRSVLRIDPEDEVALEFFSK